MKKLILAITVIAVAGISWWAYQSAKTTSARKNTALIEPAVVTGTPNAVKKDPDMPTEGYTGCPHFSSDAAKEEAKVLDFVEIMNIFLWV